MTHALTPMAEAGRPKTSAIRSLIALVIAFWMCSPHAAAESIPQAVQRMDRTLQEIDRRLREMDRRSRDMERLLQALDRRVEESERSGAASVRESERLAGEAWKPGQRFRDCDECPWMVVIPAGSYFMGSRAGQGDASERPRHRVTIARPFAAGAYEVTFAEWKACRDDGGACSHTPTDNSWGRGNRPVINVTWRHAKEYVGWLSRKTKNEYWLLSESEWEYAARARMTGRYWWGDEIGNGRANCRGCGGRWDGARTSSADSFKPNAFGLYNVHGNVSEWVEDCWKPDYVGAPEDELAWTTGHCTFRVVRGGAWKDIPSYLGSAKRRKHRIDELRNHIGFRVGRTLH